MGYEAMLFRKSLLDKSKTEREERATFNVGERDMELFILEVISKTPWLCSNMYK